MDLEAKKLIYNIDQAVKLIVEFTQGKQLEDYLDDSLLRSAVERQFEIIGDVRKRLKQVKPELLYRISDYDRIISF